MHVSTKVETENGKGSVVQLKESEVRVSLEDGTEAEWYPREEVTEL